MEKIHHAHIKQAERAGVTLHSEPEYNRIVAFWPAHNLRIFGADARYALQHMIAAQKIIDENAEHSIRIVNDPRSPYNVQIERNGILLDGSMPPIMWANEELMDHIPDGEMTVEEAETHSRVEAMFAEDQHGPTIEGVPTNGRTAHQRGFTVLDCPFIANDPEAEEQWLEEWEASAAESLEEKPEEEQPKEEKQGSVVKSKYRAIYAERGHPTNCGDALAVALNNLVLNGSTTNIEYFKMILDANGVDMSKYNTTNLGWQGRYRMTGRNKLAKVIYAAGGVMKLPNGEEIKMPADWMVAQRFK